MSAARVRPTCSLSGMPNDESVLFWRNATVLGRSNIRPLKWRSNNRGSFDDLRCCDRGWSHSVCHDMKAAYINQTGPPEVIQYGDLPTPKASPSQCLVRVAAADMNPIDTYVRSGLIAT